jgi:cytochrome b pre-mRNA-processing protein 3
MTSAATGMSRSTAFEENVGDFIGSCIGAVHDIIGGNARPAPSNAMIFPLFRRTARPDTISTLYGMIVAQARLPQLYRDYAVPDTVNGRFELIVLHLTLVLARLADLEGAGGLGQALFDRFCQDMDNNLREMGVGDLTVPKQMRRMGEAFYGRLRAYRAALAAGDDKALVEALEGNIYEAPNQQAPRLAGYVREAVRQLKALDEVVLAAGAIVFPEPASVRD